VSQIPGRSGSAPRSWGRGGGVCEKSKKAPKGGYKAESGDPERRSAPTNQSAYVKSKEVLSHVVKNVGRRRILGKKKGEARGGCGPLKKPGQCKLGLAEKKEGGKKTRSDQRVRKISGNQKKVRTSVPVRPFS